MIFLLLYYFPFEYSPKNASNNNLIDVSFLNKKIDKKIIIKNGHFAYETGEKVRFYGSNVCFDDGFPSKIDAPLIAKKMAQLGFNILRFHHMDMWSIWKGDKKTIDPIKIDLLHYFLYQLKLNGIYANINLHVSWSYPGLDNFSNTFSFGKGLDQYYEPFIEFQKDYAFILLNSFNNYTGFKLSEDPQIAFVEINNENSIEYVYENLNIIKNSKFEISLLNQWRNWLKLKYNNFLNLTNNWNPIPLNFTNLLENKNPNFQFESGKNVIQTILNSPEKHFNLEFKELGSYSWAYQFYYLDINIEENTPYTFIFKGKSSISETINVNFQQQESPWKGVKSISINLLNEWSTYKGKLLVNDNPGGKIRFGAVFNNSPHNLQITNFTLFKGLDNFNYGFNSIDEMPFPNSTYPDYALIDFKNFFLETEFNYHKMMIEFLKNNLTLKSLITNTQASFTNIYSFYRESQLSDFIDMHAYWQHPKFEPGFEWNKNHFSIENTPMINSPIKNTFYWLNLYKYENKPFTISEYDHPFPNEFTQEMFPLLSTIASFQDWDAIYQFDYNIHNKGDPFDQYFTMSINPTKISMSPITALLYRNFYINSSPNIVTDIIPLERLNPELLYKFPNFYWLPDYNFNYLFDSKRQTRFIEKGKNFIRESNNLNINITNNQWPFITNQIEWYGNNTNNIFKVNAPNVKMATGYFKNDYHKIDNFEFKMNLTNNEIASIALISMDSLPIENSKKMILSIVGKVQNTNQIWNINKTTINNGWGNGPVITQFINYDIYIPGKNKINIFILNPDGEENGTLPVEFISNKWKFSSNILNPTVSYFISREIDNNNSNNNILTYTIIGISSISILGSLSYFIFIKFFNKENISEYPLV